MQNMIIELFVTIQLLSDRLRNERYVRLPT
jgi:hypothetical protein